MRAARVLDRDPVGDDRQFVHLALPRRGKGARLGRAGVSERGYSSYPTRADWETTGGDWFGWCYSKK